VVLIATARLSNTALLPAPPREVNAASVAAGGSVKSTARRTRMLKVSSRIRSAVVKSDRSCFRARRSSSSAAPVTLALTSRRTVTSIGSFS
jgi:hypothetical protein